MTLEICPYGEERRGIYGIICRIVDVINRGICVCVAKVNLSHFETMSTSLYTHLSRRQTVIVWLGIGFNVRWGSSSAISNIQLAFIVVYLTKSIDMLYRGRTLRVENTSNLSIDR